MCVLMMAGLCLSMPAVAAQKTCELTVSTDAPAVGEAMSIELRFDGTQDMPMPDLSGVEGLQVQYRGPSTNISIVNGKTSSSITHTYVAVAETEGSVALGPFRVVHGGDEYVSNGVTLQVQTRGKGATAQRAAQAGAVAKIDVPKETVYVGQHFPLTVQLFIRDGADVRNVRMPELSVQGISLGQWAQPTQDRVQANGVVFTRVTFSADAVAETPGETKIGPAVIGADTVSRRTGRMSSFGDLDSFFDAAFGGIAAEPISIVGEAVPLRVAALPAEGKPVDFDGAIGRFTFAATLSKNTVSAGETLSLVCEVKGSGAIERIKQPMLSLDKDLFKVYEPEVVNAADGKRWTFVIVPKKEGSHELPAVSVSFFDASQGRYVISTQGPFAVTVSPGEKADVPAVIDAEGTVAAATRTDEVGSGLAFIKEQPSRWVTRNDTAGMIYFWAIQAAFPVLFFGWSTMIAHRRRMTQDFAYAKKFRAPAVAAGGLKRAQKALHAGDVVGFYDAAADTLRTYISHQLQLPIGSAGKESLSVLTVKGLSDELAKAIAELFDEADAVRYASAHIDKDVLQARMTTLKRSLAGVERLSASAKRPFVATVAAIGLLCAANAYADDAAFAKANALYRAGDHRGAFEAYERIAQTQKENGELWYDMGTCKAKQGADIEALYYLEKAARYLPQDGDVRHNIDFVRSRLQQSPATFSVTWWRKPFEPLSPYAVAAMSVLFAALAWILWALRRVHGKAVSGAVIVAACVCAAYTALVVTVRVHETASFAMVMHENESARFEPDEKANEYFALAGGDIVAAEKSSGLWVRVRRNDGRQGWVPDAAIRKL
jgi:tetratricopeptide (TPR) repeat protein